MARIAGTVDAGRATLLVVEIGTSRCYGRHPLADMVKGFSGL